MNSIILNKLNYIMTKEYDMQGLNFNIFLKPWKKDINKELILKFINLDSFLKVIKKNKKDYWMWSNIPATFIGLVGILMQTGDIIERDIIEAALEKYIEIIDLIDGKSGDEEKFYIPYSEDDYSQPDITLADFFSVIEASGNIEEKKFIEEFIESHIEYFLSYYIETNSYAKKNIPLFINPFLEVSFTFSTDFLKKNKEYLRPDSLLYNKKYKIEAQEIIFGDILPAFLKKIAMYKTDGHAENYNKHYSEEELTTILLKYNLGE